MSDSRIGPTASRCADCTATTRFDCFHFKTAGKVTPLADPEAPRLRDPAMTKTSEGTAELVRYAVRRGVID